MTNASTVDINGAAELMKVHPQTVRDMINSGELAAAQLGKAYVMLTRDILQHIENAIIRQTADRMRRTTRAGRPARTPSNLRIASAS